MTLRNRIPSLALLGGIALVVALISVIRTGFSFGVGNNVFHVPVVLGWAQQDAFAGDAFYASLTKFTSVVWPILGWVANESNVGTVFLASHFLSRFVSLLAIGWLLMTHLRAPLPNTALALLVCSLSPWLIGASTVGGHGLWVSYFTHSEVTWGPLLAALLAALAQRWVLAAGLAGLVFAINAFVGVWLLAMLAMAFLMGGAQRAWAQLPKAALAFLLLASPALVWIARSMGGTSVEFSYIDYIRTYYSEHFLIEAATYRELVIAGVSGVTGLLAALLTPRARFWWSVLGACSLVFACGVVLPHVLNHRIVFNLHLLRIDGIVQWLSIVLAIAVLSLRLGPDRDVAVRIFAMVGLLALLFSLKEPVGLTFVMLSLAAVVWIERGAQWTLDRLWTRRPVVAGLFAALVILVGMWLWEWTWLNGFLWLAMGVWAVGLCCGLPLRRSPWLLIPMTVLALLPHVSKSPGVRLEDAHPVGLTELTSWVREQGVQGPFLLPLGKDDDYFQLLSRQPVWVDWKQGAAVMWEPKFHDQWMRRQREVGSLKTPADFAAYAQAHGLRRFIVPQAGAVCPAAARQLFRNSAYLLCELD
jgi:hypothetical protein